MNKSNKKPIPSDFGFIERGLEEDGGWVIEGGDLAYGIALKEYLDIIEIKSKDIGQIVCVHDRFETCVVLTEDNLENIIKFGYSIATKDEIDRFVEFSKKD